MGFVLVICRRRDMTKCIVIHSKILQWRFILWRLQNNTQAKHCNNHICRTNFGSIFSTMLDTHHLCHFKWGFVAFRHMKRKKRQRLVADAELCKVNYITNEQIRSTYSISNIVPVRISVAINKHGMHYIKHCGRSVLIQGVANNYENSSKQFFDLHEDLLYPYHSFFRSPNPNLALEITRKMMTWHRRHGIKIDTPEHFWTTPENERFIVLNIANIRNR